VSDEGKATDRSGMPRPVVAFVATVAVLGAAGLVASLARISVDRPEVWWQFALCVGLLVTASVPWLSVRVGSQRMEFYWTDAAVAVTLTLLPPAWVVPTVAVGASVSLARQRRQPIKALFNTASPVLGATLAVALVGWLATTPVTATLRDVLVVMLAALVFGTWTDIAAAAAIGLAQRRSVLSAYRAGLSTNLVGAGGNLVATAAVLGMVRVDQRVLVIVPALLICLRQAYLGRLRGREERESWQGLLDATRAMADLDEGVVLARAAGEATRLFGADGAEIELADGRLIRGDEQGVGYDGPAGDAPERATGAVLERPIGPDAAPLGVLRLCFGDAVTLNDREQAMLGAVAAELHSALVNAAQHATARHEATHDPLTDLLNRAGLIVRGRGSLAQALAAEVDAAVVLVHISGFREIVDTLGHAAGDAVLQHTARRLAAAVLPGELVARLEADEFAVLLPKLTDPAQASHRAETLLGAVASPALIGGAGLTLTGVAGIAYSPRGEVALEELLRQAGVALHAVHSSVGRIDFYAPERDVRSVSRLVLASELRSALQDMGQLDLVYQPILDLHTGEAIAAEAQVRWHHPARGPLAPEEFMPVVEHAGLLPDLTRRVLDIALGSAADWTRHGIEVPVAINVSPRTLLDRDFPGEVAAALSRHRVPAGRLSLEITETSVVSHLAVVDRVLDELRDLGVRLALDDFGTGWSSLSHLARLPVHEVKIAAAFTERLLSSPQAAAVVRGTLEIARALDLRVVAEGVTGAIQRATLISLGCHAGQGDHLFPPLPADRIGPALWSSSVRAHAVSDGADVIPLAQRRPRD
jgi:diguanylate cyclase (GGDEF)-like protein